MLNFIFNRNQKDKIIPFRALDNYINENNKDFKKRAEENNGCSIRTRDSKITISLTISHKDGYFSYIICKNLIHKTLNDFYKKSSSIEDKKNIYDLLNNSDMWVVDIFLKIQ